MKMIVAIACFTLMAGTLPHYAAAQAPDSAGAAASPDSAAPPPILITRVRTTWPDFLGGVDIDIDWTNRSPRAVKYIHFTVALYNAVGDSIPDTITGQYSVRLLGTGPYRPSAHVAHVLWKGLFYNSTTRCARIVAAQVDYMDGETEPLRGDAVARALAPSVDACPRPVR